MITFRCSNCGDALILVRAGQFGFDADILFEPCTCVTESGASYKQLLNDYEELSEDNEELLEESDGIKKDCIGLEYLVERLRNKYNKLELESKEIKWKRRCQSAATTVKRYKEMAHEEVQKREEAEKMIEETEKQFKQRQERLTSNHNLAMDYLNIRLKESKVSHSKLIFENDKMKSKLNGGIYERSLDL